ncbi:uncharacterized protein [Physcomitrium patens]|uniref:uncharacterized protein isoform X14 n=1 Tax=Physcomitrium patens TaxID=3218 RepID=UPI000D1525A7|nr:uncharacterized protein LOC112296156 isoform X11 [Physcomitrium patens]|eukprot:XP_024404205.1 uncharacterized protein LOC112296156 isoform X11 [Physcomitrella patens]
MFIGQSRTRNQQVVDSLRTRVGGLRMGAGLGSAAEGLWRGSRHGLGFSPLRSELQLHSKQKLRRTRNYSFRPGVGAGIESLAPEECWNVVLKLVPVDRCLWELVSYVGKRWPDWNRTMALQSPA